MPGSRSFYLDQATEYVIECFMEDNNCGASAAVKRLIKTSIYTLNQDTAIYTLLNELLEGNLSPDPMRNLVEALKVGRNFKKVSLALQSKEVTV